MMIGFESGDASSHERLSLALESGGSSCHDWDVPAFSLFLARWASIDVAGLSILLLLLLQSLQVSDLVCCTSEWQAGSTYLRVWCFMGFGLGRSRKADLI
jgi:hypothetical protein